MWPSGSARRPGPRAPSRGLGGRRPQCRGTGERAGKALPLKLRVDTWLFVDTLCILFRESYHITTVFNFFREVSPGRGAGNQGDEAGGGASP